MIIIDASLAIEIALLTPDGRDAQKSLRETDDILGAPEVIDLEFLQVLRRNALNRTITDGEAHNAITLFQALPIERFSHWIVADRIWALRANLTAYDAAYVAFAELLEAPLWTRDAKIQSASTHQAEVVVI